MSYAPAMGGPIALASALSRLATIKYPAAAKRKK